MSMRRLVEAEIECMERAAALHDVSFARTVLFAIGAIFAMIGLETTMMAYGFACLSFAAAFYFQATQIPAKTNDLQRARFVFAKALVEMMAGNPGCNESHKST